MLSGLSQFPQLAKANLSYHNEFPATSVTVCRGFFPLSLIDRKCGLSGRFNLPDFHMTVSELDRKVWEVFVLFTVKEIGDAALERFHIVLQDSRNSFQAF